MSARENPPRRIVAIDRAQATASLVQVPVDRVLGQAKLARDFLGAHMAVDETKALALTLGEAIKALDLIRQGGFALSHAENLMRALQFGKAPEH